MRKIVFSLIFILTLILTACGGVEDTESESITPSNFEIVSHDVIDDNDKTDLFTVRHKETGCLYIVTDGYKSGGITQMFIEEDGVTVPYCY